MHNEMKSYCIISSLAFFIGLSLALTPGCECEFSFVGCSPQCNCVREEGYFPYYPPEDGCRSSTNSTLSYIGNEVRYTPGEYFSEKIPVAQKLQNGNFVITSHLSYSNQSLPKQIAAGIYDKNGTLVVPTFLVSNFSRTSDPFIDTTYTVKSGSPLGPVQALLGITAPASEISFAAVVLSSGLEFGLHWTYYFMPAKDSYFNVYTVNVADGTIAPKYSSAAVYNNINMNTREIRHDFLAVYETSNTTSYLMLMEDSDEYRNLSTLSVVMWRNRTRVFSGPLSNLKRTSLGALVTVINEKFVVLWNEPGNETYAVVKGRIYDPITAEPGPVFDFWVTASANDSYFDLIPINNEWLLFGHVKTTFNVYAYFCYELVPWNGVDIPSDISVTYELPCYFAVFNSPEHSAVTWDDGQVMVYWSRVDSVFSYFRMIQANGLVDLNDLRFVPVAPVTVVVETPVPEASSPVVGSTPVSSEPVTSVINTPQDASTDNSGMIAGIVVALLVVLLGGALALFFILRKRKQKKKKREAYQLEQNTTNILHTEEGKYISLPSVGLFTEYHISPERINLKKIIATGSFGAVHLAKYDEREVAVKVQQSSILSTEEFLREANLSMSIKPHPNVLTMLGITELDKDNIGLVMEYCSGGSLRSKLHEGQSLPKKEILEMLLAVAQGLSHLHASGIIHRDVAARNILVTETGTLKLADFGMSRKIKGTSDASKTNQSIGPVASMAPESIKNGLYSIKTDVWMFGILIYEIVTGRQPHQSADNLVSVAIQIREEGLTPELPSRTDPFFKRLMNDCCHFHPKKRPDFTNIIDEVKKEIDALKE